MAYRIDLDDCRRENRGFPDMFLAIAERLEELAAAERERNEIYRADCARAAEARPRATCRECSRAQAQLDDIDKKILRRIIGDSPQGGS